MHISAEKNQIIYDISWEPRVHVGPMPANLPVRPLVRPPMCQFSGITWRASRGEESREIMQLVRAAWQKVESGWW